MQVGAICSDWKVVLCKTPATYALAVRTTWSTSDVIAARELTELSMHDPKACCWAWHFYNCVVEKRNFPAMGFSVIFHFSLPLSLLSFLSSSFSQPLSFADSTISLEHFQPTVQGRKNWSFTMIVSKTIASQIYYSFMSEMWSPGGECPELWSMDSKCCPWEKLHKTLHITQQVAYS